MRQEGCSRGSSSGARPSSRPEANKVKKSRNKKTEPPVAPLPLERLAKEEVPTVSSPLPDDNNEWGALPPRPSSHIAEAFVAAFAAAAAAAAAANYVERSPVEILRDEHRACAGFEDEAEDESERALDRSEWLAEQMALTQAMNDMYSMGADIEGSSAAATPSQTSPQTSPLRSPLRPSAGPLTLAHDTPASGSSPPPPPTVPLRPPPLGSERSASVGSSGSVGRVTTPAAPEAVRLCSSSGPCSSGQLSGSGSQRAGHAGMCRFCLAEEDDPETLLLPCMCTTPVHRVCLVRWMRLQLPPHTALQDSLPHGRCEVCHSPWTEGLAPEQCELWVRRGLLTNPNYRPLPDGVVDLPMQRTMLEAMAVGSLIVQSPFRAAHSGHLGARTRAWRPPLSPLSPLSSLSSALILSSPVACLRTSDL